MIKGWGLGVNLTEPRVQTLETADPDVFLLEGRYSLLNQPRSTAPRIGPAESPRWLQL